MKYKRKKNYWQQGIRKREYVIATLQGLAILSLISYLFYGTLWCTILLTPYLIRYMKSWENQVMKKKKYLFQLQFKEAMQSLSAALNVGYSVENAIREAWKDLQLLFQKEDLILREFQFMIRQLEMNVPIEKIFIEFANRTEEEDVQLFVTVFSVAKRSGGDLIGIMKRTVNQMSQRTEVRKEIQTLTSAKVMEFRIMSIIPFAMICYLKLCFPEFVSVLYGNFFGVIVMSVCLIVYATAYEFGKRLVEIEV